MSKYKNLTFTNAADIAAASFGTFTIDVREYESFSITVSNK